MMKLRYRVEIERSVRIKKDVVLDLPPYPCDEEIMRSLEKALGEPLRVNLNEWEAESPWEIRQCQCQDQNPSRELSP